MNDLALHDIGMNDACKRLKGRKRKSLTFRMIDDQLSMNREIEKDACKQVRAKFSFVSLFDLAW
jgi:hypothetical protein